MISGFFLIERNQYRWNGILMTIVHTMFYSLVFLAIAEVFGIEVTNENLAKSIFPIHLWGYWFVTTYVGLLLVAPLLSRIASYLDKRQYQIVLCILFILNFQYLFGTVYAGHRTIMFFGFLFLLSGYMRLYGIPKWILHWRVYLFILIWGLLFLFATTINIWKGRIELIGTSYDGPVFFLSLIVFILFLCAKSDDIFSIRISKIAPYTFGVYLIHTNVFVNERVWNLLPERFDYPIILHCLMFSGLLFIICIFIDIVRKQLFGIISIDKIFKRVADKLPQL